MNVMISAATIAILVALSVFLTVFLIAMKKTPDANALERSRKDKDEIENWQDALYDALFAKKDEDTVAQMFIFNIAEYRHNCRIARVEAHPKRVIAERLVGIILIVIGCLTGIITLQIPILLAGLLLGIPFIVFRLMSLKSKVQKKRRVIEDELPRFLDMLNTALSIGLPIEQAIDITAKNLQQTTLAAEFAATMAEVSVGAGSWQNALEQMANDYHVDTLSDFVLDIVTAHKNGSSVSDSVARKCHDIKQANLLAMKERSGKLTNTILIPIVIFKIAPMFAMLLIPVIMQLNSNGFGL